jgi:hypothetical protein
VTTFVPSVIGPYVFELVVNDGTFDSAPDTVTVTVNPTKTTVLEDLSTLKSWTGSWINCEKYWMMANKSYIKEWLRYYKNYQLQRMADLLEELKTTMAQASSDEFYDAASTLNNYRAVNAPGTSACAYSNPNDEAYYVVKELVWLAQNPPQ